MSYLSGGGYGDDNPGGFTPFNPSNIPNGMYSPYLNIDPSLLRSSEPQYIMPEGAAPNRGRFELAFSQIGYGVLAGFAFGSCRGLWMGFQDKAMRDLATSVWRTQMLNYLVKNASASARPLGTIMVYYAAVGTLMSKIRAADDELNTMASGALAGALYRSTTRSWTGVAKGSGIGLGAALVWILVDRSSRENLKSMFKTMSN